MNTSLNLIVFITGAFIHHDCWDEWIIYFEREGYRCIAPPLPHKNASAEELRNRPAHDLVALNTIASLTDHFAAIVKELPAKPILIGHSLGGIVVQLLLQRGLGIAAVAMHSFPPAGINCLRFLFLKAIWESMALFTSANKTYLMPFNTWRYTVTNGMLYEQQKDLYYRLAVPESKRMIREAFRCVAKIDFKQPHPPLLLTSGNNDKLIPSSLSYFAYKKYAVGDSIADYKEFKDHSHLIFGHPAWKKEADFIRYWLQGINK